MSKLVQWNILCITVLLFLIIACTESDNIRQVDLSKKISINKISIEDKGGSLRIAIGGIITPREGFAYYRMLLDYVQEKLGMHVWLIDRENYAEINSLLKAGDIDVAFVCGGPYVDGHAAFGMNLLAAPLVNGETVYYSYIIVNKESGIEKLEDLRGRTFAFTDPLSNSGKIVPTYMLSKMDETPDIFFSKYDYTYAHDKSIKAVAEGIVDGAAVDSLIWEYINHNSPEITSRTKIVHRSPPYGIPPIVVRSGLAPSLKEKLREIFLNIHNDEHGREILQDMMIEKFVPVEDSLYDSIREMKQWLAGRRSDKA